MTLPDELTYVTVVGTIQGARAGDVTSVTFRSPSWLYGGTDNIIVPSFTISATGDADGAFSIDVPATDDPAWAPQDWAYAVTLKCGSREERGTVIVPAATVGTLKLATVFNPDNSVELGVVYLLAAAKSVAGGVAALDADGDVVDAAGNKVSGAGGTPASTVVAETSYGQGSAVGIGTAYARSDHTHGTPAAPTYSQVTGKPSTFTPSAHASSHADGGSDEVSIDGSQVTSGTVGFARLPTGTGSSQVAVGDHTHAGGSGVTPGFNSGYRTAGSLAGTNSTGAWEIVSGFTMTIAAVAGDRIVFDVSCLVDHNSSRTDLFDLAVTVSGSAVRYASSGTSAPATDGLPEQSNSSVQYGPGTFHFAFTAVSGDISGGNITVAVAHKGPGTGSLLASAAYPLRWSAINLKQ
jgi:hypothetical protein